jgi:hypothetical protein
VRTEQWRCTFWRKRNTAGIGFTELYDHQNDPNETVNLAAKPEHAALIESLKKHLPPTGSDSQPPKSGKVAKTVGGSKAKAYYDPNESRDKRYDRLYPGKPKLTEAEYISGQGGDKAESKARFAKLDGDKDGFVTRDEFIGSGKKK